MTAVPEPAERLGLDAFLRRVAEREGVDLPTAQRHVQAVFAALAQVVPRRELRDLAAQLPRDFQPLLDAAQLGADPDVPQDQLVLRVAELLSSSPRAARRSVEAVLETLAVRISEGQVQDLMRRLPADLIPALERGLARNRRATRMSVDEFLAAVAQREGVARDEAEVHAKAVFAALRELVPDKEIYDVESELSAEYAPLFSGVI
jgi:uncharacterized protein (DUF2267 family)